MTLPNARLRVVLIGWGAIAQRVYALLSEKSAGVEFVAIATRGTPATESRFPRDVEWIDSPDRLASLKPDLVVEAAGRASVAQWGAASLKNAKAFAVCSTSALGDDALHAELIRIAEERGSQILIPSGALAGLDALGAASTLPIERVVHRILKPPVAWKGTPAEDAVDLDELKVATTFFSGTARQAAQQYPANANVAAISALAGIGFDRTEVELIADPALTLNCHQLQVSGDFGVLNMMIENRPLATNPKSSELAALSLVRLIENRVRTLVV